MKVTRKNLEWVAILQSINAMAEDKISLPAKVGYAITKNKLAIIEALRPYEEERKKIISDNSGGAETLNVNKNDDPEKYEAVTNAFKEIAEIEAVVDVFVIDISSLDGHDIPFIYINNLEFMIKEE